MTSDSNFSIESNKPALSPRSVPWKRLFHDIFPLSRRGEKGSFHDPFPNGRVLRRSRWLNFSRRKLLPCACAMYRVYWRILKVITFLKGMVVEMDHVLKPKVTPKFQLENQD